MKLMYWPNEPANMYPQGQQFGPREAFEDALKAGQISALDIFSYLRERAGVQDETAFAALAIERTRSFAPDIVFVQHVTGSGVSAAFWEGVRAAVPDATIVYHDADPYDRLIKRVDTSMKAILPHAQMIYACGMGDFMNLMAAHSKAELRYLPHSVQFSRFGSSDPRAVEKAFDFIMIANRGVRKRVRFAYLPGGKRRAAFATKLSQAFGRRFALYGRGWNGLVAARGLLPFEEQAKAIQRARISVNWDHFDTVPYYFSDRLPISLAAGVPHVTTWHSGYEHQFSGCPGLYACRSVDEAVDTCRWLISKSDAQLMEEGLAGREWVLKNLESVPVYRTALDQMIWFHTDRQGEQAA